MNLFKVSPEAMPRRGPSNLALSKKIHAEKIYNIAALENSPYTFVEVQTLLDGVTVGGHKLEDQKLILNQSESWKALYKAIASGEFGLTKEFICYLHSIVADEEALEWGVFRSSQVRISGVEYLPPASDKVDSMFVELIDAINQLNPVEAAINYFLHASRAQFFFDGNKRTSRLVANGILLVNGYYIIDIPAKSKEEFNELMIKFYDTGEVQEVGDFLLGVIKKYE